MNRIVEKRKRMAVIVSVYIHAKQNRIVEKRKRMAVIVSVYIHAKQNGLPTEIWLCLGTATQSGGGSSPLSLVLPRLTTSSS